MRKNRDAGPEAGPASRSRHESFVEPLGLVDPNSTSGYNMPLFALNKMGIDPDAFFSSVLVTGSHENAVIALSGGQVQAAANWWNAPDDSNLTRMLNKGMLKNSDGTRQAFFDAPTKAPEAFAKLSDGKNKPWAPIANADYDDTIKLIKFVDKLKKKKSCSPDVASARRSGMAERDALAPFVAPSAVVALPDDHLRALGAAYARVGAGRRNRLLAGLAVLLVAVAI